PPPTPPLHDALPIFDLARELLALPQQPQRDSLRDALRDRLRAHTTPDRPQAPLPHAFLRQPASALGRPDLSDSGTDGSESVTESGRFRAAGDQRRHVHLLADGRVADEVRYPRHVIHGGPVVLPFPSSVRSESGASGRCRGRGLLAPTLTGTPTARSSPAPGSRCASRWCPRSSAPTPGWSCDGSPGT